LPAFDYKLHEDSALLRGVVNHLLRMPLYSHEEGIVSGGFHGFDEAVLRACRHLQPAPQALDSLVMQAVDGASPLNDRPQIRFGVCHQNGVCRLLARLAEIRLAVLDLRCSVPVQILVERAAEPYVDHLHTAANAENGETVRQGAIEQPEFEFVASAVAMNALVSPHLAVKGRIHVIPTGKQNAVVNFGAYAVRVRSRNKFNFVWLHIHRQEGLVIRRFRASGFFLLRN